MFRRLAEIIWTKNSIFALYLKKTKVMRVKLASIAASLVLLVGACSVPKDVAYFQGIDSLTQEQLSQMSQNYNTRICQDDMLNITVSAWDPTVVTPFNPPMFSYTQQGDEPVQASPSLYSYLVDKEGYITFPVFYTDVTDVWCLTRRQRVIVNLGGVYFQLIFLIPFFLFLQLYSDL